MISILSIRSDCGVPSDGDGKIDASEGHVFFMKSMLGTDVLHKVRPSHSKSPGIYPACLMAPCIRFGKSQTQIQRCSTSSFRLVLRSFLLPSARSPAFSAARQGYLTRTDFYTAMQLVTAAKRDRSDKSAKFDLNRVTPEQRSQYEQWFTQQLEKSGSDSLSAQQTWDFLTKSKLNKHTLKSICVLAVANPDAGIGVDEFCAAVHLTQAAVRNIVLPEVLPACLRSKPDQNASPSTVQSPTLQVSEAPSTTSEKQHLSAAEASVIAMWKTEQQDTLRQKRDLQRNVQEMVAGNDERAARVKELEESVHREMHDIVTLREELASQDNRKLELEAKIERLSSDLDKYRSEKVDLNRLLEQAQAQEDQLAAAMGEMDSSIASYRSISEELSQAKVDLETAQNKLTECNRSIDSTRNNAATVKRQAQEVACQIDETESACATARSTLAALASELENATVERSDLTARKQQLLDQNRDTVNVNNERRKMVESELQRVAEVKDEIGALYISSRDKETRRRELETRTRKLQGMVKQLKVELLWHERYVKRLNEAIDSQRREVFELQHEKPQLEAALAVSEALKNRLEGESKHLGTVREELDGKVTSLKSHSLSLDRDAVILTELVQKEQALIDRNRNWLQQNRSEVASYEEEIDRARLTIRALEEDEAALKIDIAKETERLAECDREWNILQDQSRNQRAAVATNQSERAKILADLEMHRERIQMSRSEFDRLKLDSNGNDILTTVDPMQSYDCIADEGRGSNIANSSLVASNRVTTEVAKELTDPTQDLTATPPAEHAIETPTSSVLVAATGISIQTTTDQEIGEQPKDDSFHEDRRTLCASEHLFGDLSIAAGAGGDVSVTQAVDAVQHQSEPQPGIF